MIDYESKSDYHINKAIGIILGVVKRGKVSGYYLRACPRYCEDWAAMGPIIVVNDIDIISPTTNGTEYWEAHKFFTDVKVYPLKFLDKNPLRAAAIVFLKMKEAQNV